MLQIKLRTTLLLSIALAILPLAIPVGVAAIAVPAPVAAAPKLDAMAGRHESQRERNPFRAGSAESFRRLERRFAFKGGVALGSAVRGARTFKIGHEPPPRSWSTVKVPVAHAVIAAHGGISKTPPQIRDDIRTAITRSDNAATTRLFNSLGTNRAKRVERALKTGGDKWTRLVRGGGWGNTRWTLRRQQKFAAGLRCLRHARPIMKQMRSVVSEQRWGLGRLPRRPAFKGGWGPTGGRYVVRQFGQVKAGPRHVLAVAIFAQPDSGSFDDATHALNEVARWIRRRVVAGRLLAPRCRR